jgi:hypothetical protein
MPAPIQFDASRLNLSPRVFTATSVGGSPAAASETVIATITTSGDIAALAGVLIVAWAAYTIGTSGVSQRLRIRQTNTSGTTVADTGAVSATAGNLYSQSIVGFDTSPVLPGQVYVVTLTIGSGAATSTVSAVGAAAIVI